MNSIIYLSCHIFFCFFLHSFLVFNYIILIVMESATWQLSFFNRKYAEFYCYCHLKIITIIINSYVILCAHVCRNMIGILEPFSWRSSRHQCRLCHYTQFLCVPVHCIRLYFIQGVF